MRRVLLVVALAAVAAGPAAAARGSDPSATVSSVGRWEVYDATDPLDGSANYHAGLDADDEIAGSRDKPPRPRLAVVCSHQGFALEIQWPDVVDTGPHDRLLGVTVDWKTDDGPVRHDDWGAVKHAVLKTGRSGLGWARRWSAAKTLVVRVPDRHGGQDATFQLDGLDQVVARVSQMNCG